MTGSGIIPGAPVTAQLKRRKRRIKEEAARVADKYIPPVPPPPSEAAGGTPGLLALRAASRSLPSLESFAEALYESRGNFTETARKLGVLREDVRAMVRIHRELQRVVAEFEGQAFDRAANVLMAQLEHEDPRISQKAAIEIISRRSKQHGWDPDDIHPADAEEAERAAAERAKRDPAEFAKQISAGLAQLTSALRAAADIADPRVIEGSIVDAKAVDSDRGRDQ